MSLLALLWIAFAQSFVPIGADRLASRATARDRERPVAECACAPAVSPALAERSVRTSPARLGGRSDAYRLLALAPAPLAAPRGGPLATGVPTIRSMTGAGWVVPSLTHQSDVVTITGARAAMVDHTSRVVAARGGLVPYFLIPPPIG